MVIRTARVYDHPSIQEGEIPLLVDRLWPRGMARTHIPELRWMKEWAPSSDLRKWFHAHREQFEPFRERYLRELEENASRIRDDLSLFEKEKKAIPGSLKLLLLYGSRDLDRNNATVLRDYLLSIGLPRPTPMQVIPRDSSSLGSY